MYIMYIKPGIEFGKKYRIHKSLCSVPVSRIYALSPGTGWWQLLRVLSPLGRTVTAATPCWVGEERAQLTFSKGSQS